MNIFYKKVHLKQLNYAIDDIRNTKHNKKYNGRVRLYTAFFFKN